MCNILANFLKCHYKRMRLGQNFRYFMKLFAENLAVLTKFHFIS